MVPMTQRHMLLAWKNGMSAVWMEFDSKDLLPRAIKPKTNFMSLSALFAVFDYFNIVLESC